MRASILILATTLLAAAPAQAQSEPPVLSAIIAGLEAQGYRVTDVDVDGTVIEVEAIGTDQREVDIRVDPQTGGTLDVSPD